MKLKDKIIKNRVGILIFIGVLLVVTIIIGISYAYFFNIEIKNNNTISGNINTNSYIFATKDSGSLSITLDQDKLDISNASNDYSSYMSNTGSNITISLDANGLNKVYCSYDLVYVPSAAYKPNEGAVNAGLKELTLSGTSDKGNSFSEIDISGSSTITLISGVKFSTDTNDFEDWSFIVKYYNLDVIQDNVIGQTFAGNIKVANTNCSFNEPIYGGDYVLLKSTGATTVEKAKLDIEGRGSPNFSVIADTEEGLYAAEDDLGTSYYFRGAVDNNWVKYGKYNQNMYNCNNQYVSENDTGESCTKIASSGDDMYWRIIRINGDRSIRMIYSGVTPPTESTKVVKTSDTSLGNIPFNSNYNSAEYVGYMYTIGQQHGTNESSDIKTYLDKWVADYTNLTATGTKIVDQIYCNDRTASTSEVAYSNANYTTLTSWNSTGTDYYYGSYGRLTQSKKSPVLTCPTASDKFTVNTSNGNGALTYPVGLITADEVAMAGGIFDSDNSSYYLYTNQYYWLVSPFYFNSNTSRAFEFYVFPSGNVVADGVTHTSGARPVVSLSSKVKLSGSGTYNDVYTVS